MRMSLENLYRNTHQVNIYQGPDKIDEIIDRIQLFGNRILVITGKNSFKKNGHYKVLLNKMKTKNLEIYELDNNDLPLLSTVIKGQRLCQTHQINFILGIGGGCCMDLAKAIAYTSAYNDNAGKLLTNQISNSQYLPFATIVTYPSSGSETNGSAQIYDKQKEEHIGIQGIYPDFTWLNVEYIRSLKSNQLTWAYLTSFIQLSIQYIGIDRNKIKEKLIESLIRSILFNLDKIHDNQITEDVYIDLLYISAFSSNSIFNKNGDFSIYPISTIIQDHFNISYAQALTILYPYWFQQIS